MKRRIVFLLAAVAATLICLASAQTGPSSSKLAADPKLKASIQPLTPKSAMAPARRSSVAGPKSGTSGRDTNAELGRLEKQSTKIAAAKKPNTGVSKANPGKPVATSSGSGSGINASYQKPRVPRK